MRIRRAAPIGSAVLALVAAACRLPAVGTGAGGGAPSAPGSKPAAEAPATSDPCSTAAAPPTPPVCPALAGNADVLVSVTTMAGRAGGGPALSRGLTSMNFSQELARRGDYVPTPDPATVTLLAALRPAFLRWVPGHDGQLWVWSRNSTSDPKTSNYVLTPALVDAFIGMCRAVGAAPLLALNFKTGDAEAAADLIRYCNVEKGYGVVWVQVGNEPDLPADSGLPNPAPLLPTSGDMGGDLEAYAARFLAFRTAVLRVDPNLRLVGPEMMTGQDFFGFGASYPEAMTPILKRLGANLSAVSWHYYAKYSGQTDTRSSIFVDPNRPETLLQEDAPDWPTGGMNYIDQQAPRLREARNQYSAGAQLWVTEFAEDPGTKYNGRYLADRVVGALWAADLLGRFASEGIDAVFRFEFKGTADHYYALVDTDNQPRPEYGTYWLYAQVMGERFGRVDYGRPDDPVRLAVHAGRGADDHTLGLVLVNKTTQPLVAALSLKDFLPLAARQYRLTGGAYGDTTITVNGQPLSAAVVAAGLGALPAEAATPCPQSLVQVPALSAVFIAFDG